MSFLKKIPSFISANELCVAGQKKTVTTQHVLKALESCDMAHLVPGVEEAYKRKWGIGDVTRTRRGWTNARTDSFSS